LYAAAGFTAAGIQAPYGLKIPKRLWRFCTAHRLLSSAAEGAEVVVEAPH